MGELISACLGQLCRFQAGDAFKKELQGRGQGDFPFVKVSDMNIVGNEIYIRRSTNWVTDCDVSNHKYHIHQPGAVIFAKIGVALTYNRRRIVTIPTIIDNNMMAAEPNYDAVNPVYFYYLLSTIDFNEVSAGSALPYLTQKDLSKIAVLIHPIGAQAEIATLLGALDNKIELNRQTNETLEALARAVFKDWFVDFGPTRAKAEGRPPYLAPELWELFPDAIDDEDKPVGWSYSTVGERFDVKIGRTPPRKEGWHFTEGSIGVPWLSIRDLANCGAYVHETSEGLTEQSVKDYRVPVVAPDTVLVSFKLTVGRVAIAQRAMATNEAIAHLNPIKGSPSSYFSYCWMQEFDYSTLGSTSSIATAVNSKSVKGMRFPKFGKEIEDEFSLLTEPLFKMLLNNSRESRALAQTRDLLLPKLMSGEIRLKDAEQAVAEVA